MGRPPMTDSFLEMPRGTKVMVCLGVGLYAPAILDAVVPGIDSKTRVRCLGECSRVFEVFEEHLSLPTKKDLQLFKEL